MSTAVGHINHFLEESAEKCQIQFRFRPPAEDQEVHGDEPIPDEEQPTTDSNRRKRPAPSEEVGFSPKVNSSLKVKGGMGFRLWVRVFDSSDRGHRTDF